MEVITITELRTGRWQQTTVHIGERLNAFIKLNTIYPRECDNVTSLFFEGIYYDGE